MKTIDIDFLVLMIVIIIILVGEGSGWYYDLLELLLQTDLIIELNCSRRCCRLMFSIVFVSTSLPYLIAVTEWVGKATKEIAVVEVEVVGVRSRFAVLEIDPISALKHHWDHHEDDDEDDYYIAGEDNCKSIEGSCTVVGGGS